MFGLIVICVWLCKWLSGFRKVSGASYYSFLLFEGQNSITILGVHLLVMGVAAIPLKRFLVEGWLYYTLMFLIIVVASNACILLFNRFVPFLVNHPPKKQTLKK